MANMFPRKALDLIILGILNEHKDGLTGYSLIKEMQMRFGPIRRFSPGTIYPKLKRLRHRGLIVDEGKIFKISAEGKQKLDQNVPEVIDNSIKFMPTFYRELMRPLTFQKRMNYFHNMTHFCDPSDCSPLRTFFDDSELPESITDLKHIRKRLEKAKQEIRDRLKVELNMLDEKIAVIDKKITESQEEKASYTEIPVEDGDLNTE